MKTTVSVLALNETDKLIIKVQSSGFEHHARLRKPHVPPKCRAFSILYIIRTLQPRRQYSSQYLCEKNKLNKILIFFTYCIIHYDP
jgi:hypothetical protein